MSKQVDIYIYMQTGSQRIAFSSSLCYRNFNSKKL